MTFVAATKKYYHIFVIVSSLARAARRENLGILFTSWPTFARPMPTSINNAGPSAQYPTQCVFIENGGKTAPPNCTTPIPFNKNSTRALSKKNRVYALRDFLLRNYPSSMTTSCTVLDVAGGRGDLSWILKNVDGVNSIIADPRIPNHCRLVKSVNFLLEHPGETKIRSVEDLPTHQPLAKLLPRLLMTRGITERSDAHEANGNECVRLATPNFMRMHLDNALVECLRKVTSAPALECDEVRVWDDYWEGEQTRINSNKIHYGGTAPTKPSAKISITENSQITEPRSALGVFKSLDLIVGFHPDQATEATIDLALLLGIPFVVVPCCVFPSEFPDRTLSGKRVRTHSEFLDYLCMKHCKIRKEKLPFSETETAKNVVLYMTKEDMA